MRFINTLENVRLYLMQKPAHTHQEKSLLAQICEDLEYFPRGTLHRDDLVEYGYDAQLIDCGDMATLAKKIGEDCWSQISKEQIPIIADSIGCPHSNCPVCSGAGAFKQSTHMWECENPECSLSWSYMKYIYVGYTALTCLFLKNNIGFSVNDEKETPMYIPLTEHRKYFSGEPLKEQFFHIMHIKNAEIVPDLKDSGYKTEKVNNKRGIEKFGADAYWISCYKTEETTDYVI